MSRHKCTKAIYKAFLQATSVRYSGLALSEVSPEPLSHDSVSRWLQSQHFRPREVWHIAKTLIDKNEPCLLIADDAVLDKHRSHQIELVHYQYSGNAHDVIAGIGLVNFVWYGLDSAASIPIDYRVYDKETDGKTKNEHFREMLKLGKSRGILPEAVVFDAWYSSLDNLKSIRDLGWNWVAGLKKNRKVNRNQTLE
ncbi:transposase, partial [Piscirickettsia litoralis]|uniref:transposase n=1 Tax=Piscirickettsia litoralis TaxID=1891921 RepID=UPI00098224DB